MENYDLATGIFLAFYNGCAIMLIVIARPRHMFQLKAVAILGWLVLIAIQFMMWAGLGVYAP